MYSLNDINQMSYQEYGVILDTLVDKVQKHCQRYQTKFDLVAPILRSGGIPGSVIAIKLGIIQILPLQFKYAHNPTKIVQVLALADLTQQLPDSPKILICENNTVTAGTAVAAVGLLRERFPASELSYATVAKVYGSPDALDHIKEYFYGIETDEKFRLSEVDLKSKNVRPKITIFPWENPDEELQAINSELQSTVRGISSPGIW